MNRNTSGSAGQEHPSRKLSWSVPEGRQRSWCGCRPQPSVRQYTSFFLLAGVFRAAWNGAHGIRSMLMAYDQCVCVRVNAVQVVERVVDGQGQVMTMKRQDESGVVGSIAAKIPCIFVVECEGGGELAFVV